MNTHEIWMGPKIFAHGNYVCQSLHYYYWYTGAHIARDMRPRGPISLEIWGPKVWMVGQVTQQLCRGGYRISGKGGQRISHKFFGHAHIF